MSLLDPNDITTRLEELKTLTDGWLDGERGFAPNEAGLDWLAQAFQNYCLDNTLPYIYPTAEGGIQTEWSIGGCEISLEIDLDSHRGYWHCLELATDQMDERTLELDNPAEWQWLVKGIGKLKGTGHER